jgi:hypothetical protein
VAETVTIDEDLVLDDPEDRTAGFAELQWSFRRWLPGQNIVVAGFAAVEADTSAVLGLEADESASLLELETATASVTEVLPSNNQSVERPDGIKASVLAYKRNCWCQSVTRTIRLELLTAPVIVPHCAGHGVGMVKAICQEDQEGGSRGNRRVWAAAAGSKRRFDWWQPAHAPWINFLLTKPP